MKLHYEDGKTYYDIASDGIEQFNSWLDAIVVSANPQEVDPDDQLEYLEDESTIRQLGKVSIQAYFVKSVKPEFRYLGYISETNGSGIQFYTPPKNLQPGQYDISYAILLQDLAETSERYDGSYNIAFRLSDTSHEQQEMSVARPTREHLHPNEYHDGFQYVLDENESRLYVAHRCFRTDLVNSRFLFHPLVGERATRDPVEKQLGSISRLLDIAKPEFIDT